MFRTQTKRTRGSPKRNHLLTWNEPVVCAFPFDYCYWKVLYLLTHHLFPFLSSSVQNCIHYDRASYILSIVVVLKLFKVKKDCKSPLASISVCFGERVCRERSAQNKSFLEYLSLYCSSLPKILPQNISDTIIYWCVMELSYKFQCTLQTTSVPNIVIVIILLYIVQVGSDTQKALQFDTLTHLNGHCAEYGNPHRSYSIQKNAFMMNWMLFCSCLCSETFFGYHKVIKEYILRFVHDINHYHHHHLHIDTKCLVT